jgi:hypothetical protein
MIGQKAPLGGAERDPDSELMPAAFCAREQDVADVGAGQQQDERGGAEQGHHRGPEIAGRGFGKRRCGERVKAWRRRVQLAGRFQPSRDGAGEIAAGLR